MGTRIETVLLVMLPLVTTRARTNPALVLATCVGLLASPVWAHGGFDERIEAANRAVATDPTLPHPRLVRAELHRRHGHFEAALRDLDHASRLSSEPGKIDYFRGLVYLDAGRPLEADAALRSFLAREPTHPAAREARARALLKRERPLAAAREYDLAIAQQPIPVPDYYVERARALAAAGDAHLEEAIAGIDEGIVAMGPLVTLERAAIELELRRGATDAALVRLDRMAERSARRETWLAERGRLLAQAGRTEEAKQSFARALAELDELSSQRRRTPAMSRLEAEIQASLARLADPASRNAP